MTTNINNLIKRLRRFGDSGIGTTNDVMNLCNEAAETISNWKSYMTDRKDLTQRLEASIEWAEGVYEDCDIEEVGARGHGPKFYSYANECHKTAKSAHDAACVMTDASAAIVQLQEAWTPRNLEWVDVPSGYGPETYESECPFGFYQVFVDEDSASGYIKLEFAKDQVHFGTSNATIIGKYPTFPDAKNAAQLVFVSQVLKCFNQSE